MHKIMAVIGSFVVVTDEFEMVCGELRAKEIDECKIFSVGSGRRFTVNFNLDDIKSVTIHEEHTVVVLN